MYTIFVLLALCLSAVAAVPAYPEQRIVGGTQVGISSYPSISSLMYNYGGWWEHKCGGTILSNTAVITAAHCAFGDRAVDWRMRVGSAMSNSGGTIHEVSRIIIHPSFNRNTLDNDVAIFRSQSIIQPSTTVRFASYARANYNLPDNSTVWQAGWGATFLGGPNVQALRHVQIWTINSVVCMQRYANIRFVSANMLCSGWLDVGGRDQCNGDSGGPLYHNGVLVGISSWSYGCALPRYPGVNARVSRFAAWIANNI